ncbi:hypothetical protein EV121DRAFT_297420 [Schizophyllum commune]
MLFRNRIARRRLARACRAITPTFTIHNGNPLLAVIDASVVLRPPASTAAQDEDNETLAIVERAATAAVRTTLASPTPVLNPTSTSTPHNVAPRLRRQRPRRSRPPPPPSI